MTVVFAVTYEFATRPPLTFRGTVTAGREHVCAARAIKLARTALAPVNWTSVVCVLLERCREDGTALPEQDAEPPEP
jgi:hypothetical protein